MSTFKSRTTESELMDDVSLDANMLKEVLRDVSRTNRLLGGNRITQKAVLQILGRHPDKKHRIMDVGCGDGTMLRQLAQVCRKKKYQVQFLGVDINKSAIILARKYGEEFPEIAYYTGDILNNDNQEFSCDISLCTLTLHHIPSKEIPGFLAGLASKTRKAVIVNDLQRSPLAYYLFKIFSAIFIKTKIARHDGLVSIKRGFKREELFAFARQVPAFYAKVNWKWAFRYLLILAPINSIDHE